jgi:hypothetical protein
VILDNFRVSQNGALSATYGGKVVTRTSSESYYGTFHNVYSSPVITGMIQLGRTRWTEHVALTGEMRNAYKALVRKDITWRTYIFVEEFN